MFVVESYPLAVFFCVITMLCWGSWANTQKAVGKRWRFELFYWDYTFGVLSASLGFAFTMGSTGTGGRSFLADLTQADSVNLGWAVLGGVIFNAANLLLVAAIDLAGMAVAFPAHCPCHVRAAVALVASLGTTEPRSMECTLHRKKVAVRQE